MLLALLPLRHSVQLTAFFCTLIVTVGFVKVWFSAKRVTGKFHLAFDPKNSAEKLKTVKADAYINSNRRQAEAKKIDITNIVVGQKNVATV